ncbi:hypothetical protein ABBQ32_013303 [Trebouxia sp. C0010 RCD-2024]
MAAQWDYEANNGTPDDVVAQSNHKFHWHCCECGCTWSATPDSCVSQSKTGCPQCAKDANKTKKKTKHPTFAECKHPLLAEWDHKRNAARGNSPDNTKLHSSKHIFWLCTKCPAGQEHSWPAQPYHRNSRWPTGCPYCAGMNACRCNSLQALYPDTAAEWDHGKNHSQPSNHPGGSRSPAWWFTPQRGSWQQTICSRTTQVQQKTAMLKRIQERQNSPGRVIQALYPDTAAEWDYTKDQGQPSDYPSGSTYLAWWSSPQRGSWQATIHACTTSAKAKSARLIGRQQRLDATHLF